MPPKKKQKEPEKEASKEEKKPEKPAEEENKRSTRGRDAKKVSSEK